MAPVKKTSNPEVKPKAASEKATPKPDASAPKKAAGTRLKTPAIPKKTPEKTPSKPPQTKPTEADASFAESVIKPMGRKKAPIKAVADTPRQFPSQVETALQAIKEGKAIELVFSDAVSNPPRTFEPRQLIFDTLTKAWFVWGWDRRYNAERHHRLDQLAEINLVEGPGRSAQGPYQEGTPANLIGGWLGGEPIHVKATLQKQWLFAVKQAPPAFPEFKFEDGEDGKATVSFVATDLRAIARWCLQFGEGIQVLEPQRLVDRVKQVGVAWVGKPVAAAPAPTPRPAPQPVPRPEYKPEHKPEHKSDYKSEHRREHGKDRDEAPKKGSRVEIRIEKL